MFEIICTGYLVADPTSHSYDKEGKAMKVANFRIGCKDRNGKDHFINCSAWNAPGAESGRADVVIRNLCKGRHVLVRGIPNATYGKGKDGKDYANLGVIVNDLEFLDKKPESMRQTPAETQAPAAVPQNAVAPAQSAPSAPAVQPAIDPAVLAAIQAVLAQQQVQATQPAKVEEPAPAQATADGSEIPDFSDINEDDLPF